MLVDLSEDYKQDLLERENFITELQSVISDLERQIKKSTSESEAKI